MLALHPRVVDVVWSAVEPLIPVHVPPAQRSDLPRVVGELGRLDAKRSKPERELGGDGLKRGPEVGHARGVQERAARAADHLKLSIDEFERSPAGPLPTRE